MSMAFKKMSFEESLEHAPLSEDELEKLQEELESFDYYHPFDCEKY